VKREYGALLEWGWEEGGWVGGGHWNAERETCPNATFLHQRSYMDLSWIRLRPLVRG